MTRTQAISGGIIAVAALAASSYASPYWDLYRMQSALERRDADTVSSFVDFPALRESVKGQMMAMMSRQKASPEMSANPFAALGQAMALALINPVIDATVSPAGVIAMLENGSAKFGSGPGSGPDSATGSAPKATREKVNYSVAYRGWDKVAITREGHDSGSFILKRDGLWSWKLAAIELPRDLLASAH